MGLDVQLALEPLPDIYLRSDRDAQAGPVGDIRYVYAFSTIAFFVLLLACINFMNFSTARSLDRAREVGVRKTVGSSRAALIQQFLSESVLVAVIALVGAVALVSLVLPFFNSLTGKAITADVLEQPASLLRLLGLALIAGVLAGSYPAFVLSGFRPVEVLKGRFTSSGRGVRMRQLLVVLQFAVSIVLIVGTFAVYGQLRYMENQDLGFEKEQVLVVKAAGLSGKELQQHYQTMKQAFLDHPSIAQATASSKVPGTGRGGGVMFPEGLPEGESRRMDYFAVDHDFIETMGIEMVAGRDLSSAFEPDAREAALINETAVANIGWGSTEEAIGKTIVAGWDGRPLTVVGVFKDYHHLSLRQQIVPTLLLINPSWFGYFSARVTGGQVPQVMAYLEAIWNQRFPEHTFTYFFLDEHYDAQYRTERNLMQLFGVFALLAIVIACLGLFGLVLLMTRQRAKEIGIRKALGASSASIVTLLSKDFLKLVLVAFVVAVPVAYLAMNRWLEDFAYRIDLSWWIFLFAGLAAFAIAWVTVSGQSVRAARTNPVKSLRYE